MGAHEKQIRLLEVYRKLADAEKQLAEGVSLFDGEEVFCCIREKHGV